MKTFILFFVMIIILLAGAFFQYHSYHNEVRATTVNGIDVSHYQGTVIWGDVFQEGYRFAFAKATEGTSYVDPEFENNMKNGTAAGLYMGAYHFADPEQDNATAEADHFISVISPYLKDGYLKPVLDLEEGSSLGKTALSNWVNIFMNEIRTKTGLTPIIYTNSNYADNYLDSSVTQWPLWIANYGVSSPNTGIWDTWAFWQYSDSGSVTGIAGSVDTDYYNGDLQSLYANFVIHNSTVPGNLSYYDRQGAIGYAYKWWNGINPHYNNYSLSTNESANFVSEAIIAGGLSLWRGYDGKGGGVTSTSNGTIPSCNYLQENLVRFQHARYAYVTTVNFTIPVWLDIGDVIIFGNNTGNAWQLATLVVYRNGNHVGIATHGGDVWNKTLSYYFPDHFTRINFYHIPNGNKTNLTIFSVTVSALHVRAGPGTGYTVIGTIYSGEKYVAFDYYTDSAGYGWWKFFYDDRVGWCAASYTEESYGDIVVINVSTYLNVRAGAGTSYSIVGQTYHGMLYAKIGTEYNSGDGLEWDDIWYASEQRWIAAEYTGVPELSPMIILIITLIVLVVMIWREKR